MSDEGRDSTNDEGAAAAMGLPWVISGSLLACSAFAGGIYFYRKYRSRNAVKQEKQVNVQGEYPRRGRQEGRTNDSLAHYDI